MSVQIYEVMKQYVFLVEGLSHTVKGRISRNHVPRASQPFMWEISHHYKPSKGAGVYYPSKMSTATIEEAEGLLFAYAKGFTSIGVTPNENF